jgi:hypothetical protein
MGFLSMIGTVFLHFIWIVNKKMLPHIPSHLARTKEENIEMLTPPQTVAREPARSLTPEAKETYDELAELQAERGGLRREMIARVRQEAELAREKKRIAEEKAARETENAYVPHACAFEYRISSDPNGV